MSYYKVKDIPQDGAHKRYKTGFEELDKVLNGGLVSGAIVLLAGTPGVGKSTLLLQIADNASEMGYRVLYIAGEESLGQIKARAERLGTLSELVYCSEETEVEKIVEIMDEVRPSIVIVDSLQMMHSIESARRAGTPTQMKLSLTKFTKVARSTGRAIILVGHSTKGGYIAGLQATQHMVDATFFMDSKDNLRLLEVKKNRYGPSDKKWAAEMTARGLVEAELPNESEEEEEEKPDKHKNLKAAAAGVAAGLGILKLLQPKQGRRRRR